MARYRWLAIGIALVLLTGCTIGSGDTRPTDDKLREGIKLLMTNFAATHPQMVNWDSGAVALELKAKLPLGQATEAGWTLNWPQAGAGEFSRVVVPWSLLGQYPNKFLPDSNNYSGGKPVPDSISTQIRSIKNGGDLYFAALVNIRFSQKDARWIIFTSIPYLPVTDNAYGWAHLVNGKWQIADFGTATVGCGIVPSSIHSEFGFSCPPA